MDRIILSRLLVKRHIKMASIRCYCDKTEKPPESLEHTEQIKNKSEPKDSAKEKINMLLKSMIVESKIPRKVVEELAKPGGIYNKQRKVTQREDIEQKLVKAASDVAESMGQDKKRIEAELLSKVLGKINPSPSQVNLDELIGRMNVDTSKEKVKSDQRERNLGNFTTNGDNRRYSVQDKFVKQTLRAAPKSADVLFGSKALDIFDVNKEVNYGTKVEVWDAQFEKELKLSVQRHPDNYIEKMILWTDEGKIWKFPIDNEQGLENDQKVPFTDHIFLDVHLEGWCPEEGPVRHFMELVCVGLSKNPFYTVQEKKDHINWFKDFFVAREKLLKEIGAIPSSKASAETSNL